MSDLKISSFQPGDQDRVRTLILNGLVEHWGYLAERLNPDLDDIAAAYSSGEFLVAWLDGEIVGTGAYLPRGETEVEIVRMSVKVELRRGGIGWGILSELCVRAYQSGYRKAVLETTRTWIKVIEFYQKFGFQFTHFKGDDAYFSLDLGPFISSLN